MAIKVQRGTCQTTWKGGVDLRQEAAITECGKCHVMHVCFLDFLDSLVLALQSWLHQTSVEQDENGR